MDGNLPLLIALLCLVAMSAFFSATETAYTSLNRVRMKSRADNGDRRAAKTLTLAEDYDKLLSTILIGNNIVNNVATTIGAVLFIRLLGDTEGPTVSAAVLTVVILIFGEVSPKSLAKESPEAVALATAPVLRFFLLLLTPLNFLFSLWKKLLSKVIRKSADPGITEEELVTMVDQAESEGGLDQEESELIRSAIEFSDLEAGEILTPRVDIAAIPDTADADMVARLFAETGYSRLPVYHGDIDNITGIIHEKDFHAARYHGISDLSAITSQALYTAASAKISDLLRTLQRAKVHMAIVVDEYGGTAGLVTLEDILEELVGEIWDEHDEVVEEFRLLEDGSYRISCNADLSDLYDLFSIKGDCDAATVSGWVLDAIGHIPLEGEQFSCDGLHVTVTKVDHRRVLEIRVAAESALVSAGTEG